MLEDIIGRVAGLADDVQERGADNLDRRIVPWFSRARWGRASRKEKARFPKPSASSFPVIMRVLCSNWHGGCYNSPSLDLSILFSSASLRLPSS